MVELLLAKEMTGVRFPLAAPTYGAGPEGRLAQRNMYFIYVLLSKKDGNFYTGYSRDPWERLECHNSGKVDATKYRVPFEMIYLEGFVNQQGATSREKFFKTGWGRTHLNKILKNYFNSTA